MSIKISTEKVVTSDGVMGRKITDVKMLKFKGLPKLYTQGAAISDPSKPVVYLSLDGQTILTHNIKNKHWSYTLGRTYSEKLFKELIKHCKAAGWRLKACNAELRMARVEWNGKEDFII